MLLSYVIIKLSESKTTNGAFTYYIITEGEKRGSPKLWGKGRGLAL